MRSVEEHLAAVLALGIPLPVERVPVREAIGRALAEDVIAPIQLPPFDNSSMDGYAVRAADVAAAPVTLPVAADIAAGAAGSVALQPRTAARIMTGAPIPPGADAVVQVELTDAGLEHVRIDQPVAAGTAIRPGGGDALAGDRVMHAGDEVTHASIGVIASLGIARLIVHRRPRVAVFATGDELAAAGQPLGPGQIYDSNSAVLAACLDGSQADVVSVEVLTDDVVAARTALSEAARTADLIVTSGGISAGAYEVIKLAFEDSADVEFMSVAVQPGKPQGVGTIDGVPLLALPGNPVSTFVCFELFVRPLLRKLTGHAELSRPILNARLLGSVEPLAGRRQYLPGIWNPTAGTVNPAGPRGSHRVAVLAKSNCLIIIASGEEAPVLVQIQLI